MAHKNDEIDIETGDVLGLPIEKQKVLAEASGMPIEEWISYQKKTIYRI